MRVLVIEDISDIAANLNAYLEPRGYSLDFATNGYGGLALVVKRICEHRRDTAGERTPKGRQRFQHRISTGVNEILTPLQTGRLPWAKRTFT
jgi:CheY-like chemotaxis protein